ncbi:MAG: AAA family ATPase [Candidatus Omnitrophica bacterium]|nr:AAA family ATPase [Candidatus Omnitrophota bacterium]
MYFKKLELVGFKSFYNKTVLNFEPGVTAVVGPNGCGKSNVFDSIRWVLGEQSVKALRGSDMQDVIFNGTESKEPLGMAEVTLTFDNSQRFFSVDHHEVAITRRIFRSGESEYLLNKTLVRLKDVLDLLMGTGIGAESYSLIQQGKIDLVLSSRPEDRRLVFDEASGISKYKSQKRETMRHLEETEQNLLRVNDIVIEVKRQIGSLERQANKARRYKEVFEELQAKEISLALLEKKALLVQKEEVAQNLKSFQEQESTLFNEINEQGSRIAAQQHELKDLEAQMARIKEEAAGLNNSVASNEQHARFNSDRIKELESDKERLIAQIETTKKRLDIDEEKLKNAKEEYSGIEKIISEKTSQLQVKEEGLKAVNRAQKTSLENIAAAKKNTLDIATRISNLKNTINASASQEQIHAARKKRLEIEHAKVNEEYAATEINLNEINQELENLEKDFTGLNGQAAALKGDKGDLRASLDRLNAEIEELDRKRIALESHRQFLEQVKTKYEDMGEAIRATVYLEKIPEDKITGLVVKINEPFDREKKSFAGEAKPIDLDAQNLIQRINEISLQISEKAKDVALKQNRSQELGRSIVELEGRSRQMQIQIANKKTYHENALVQFNKIKEEKEIISLELEEVRQEMSSLAQKLIQLRQELSVLNSSAEELERTIFDEQNNILRNNTLKEEALVSITQIRTELEALNRRIGSDQATLKILEDTCLQDKETLEGLIGEQRESETKKESLNNQIKELEQKNLQSREILKTIGGTLRDKESTYAGIAGSIDEVVEKIDSDRKNLDSIKNRVYELQMQAKDVDFKYSSIRDRILQGYKADLDAMADIGEQQDEGLLSDEIQKLKEKLDSYGTVNLVAIEEYDELKKRYDFLTQQQNDLLQAKESLHEAILKINRITKKMFVETFEKVQVEFRNYFRLLFNGGDCQLFLLDEQDPLESGIEIVCRPPGKKLQNILLLSGGEKSMAAIALIFAIFKVKPAPFCVLDEIDAALDEANVDRFSRILQEFTKDSQFIVITHNKKTIANADVMYGITMEESGVSKIVSVKFSQNKAKEVAQPEAEKVAEPA